MHAVLLISFEETELDAKTHVKVAAAWRKALEKCSSTPKRA
jgi:hypothetical protein